MAGAAMSYLAEPLAFLERPWLLLPALVPILAAIPNRWLKQRDDRRWKLLGNRLTLARLVAGPNQSAYWRPAFVGLAWLLASIAAAGPRWGTAEVSGVAVGRDLVIVLDFSRSMWAEDIADAKALSRWQAAVAGAKD